MSSMRIVLVDPLGDVLFSGESWLGRESGDPSAAIASSDNAPETVPERDDDGCPRTLRSGGSGIFPVERANPANEVEDFDGEDASVPTLRKRDERAA